MESRTTGVDLVSMFEKIKKLLFKPKKVIGGNPFSHNKFRVFFYYVGCPYCRMVYGVIERINARLKPGKRIATVNIYSSDKRVEIIDPDAVPFIYLDGYAIKGVTSKVYIEELLKSYMKEMGDYIEQKKYY